MTRRLATIAALAVLLTGSSVAAPAEIAPGLLETTFSAAHHAAPISGAIWYPARDGGASEIVFENAVFEGVLAQPGAVPEDGAHPLVLLSHGFRGTHRSLSWLAAGLAARGAIVVGIDHPGSSFVDFDLPRAQSPWTRAQDVSAVLDAMLEDPPAGLAIDGERIAAIGFSYGGDTVLRLAGLLGDLDAYRASCLADLGAGGHCDLLAREGFDLGSLDPALWNGDRRDPRLSHVAAIDPGPLYPMAERQVAAIATPLLLVGLGEGADRLKDTDFSDDGSGLASLLAAAGKDVAIVEIVPAWHFTAMPLCRPEGPAILVDEGDDPVCDDPPGTDRAAAHARIVAEVAALLGL